MSEQRPNEHSNGMTDAEATRAILDRVNKAVFVIYGVARGDKSAKLFGIYTNQQAAEDRVKMLNSAASAYQLTYAKVLMDQAYPVMLEP